MGKAAAVVAFLAAYAFFQFAYPYHLMRREQLNVFLYDWDYIGETYRGIGSISRFAGDFVDQFLFFPVIGPVLVALILTAIGACVFRICRHGLGKWPSLGIAAIVFAWSFLRETENQYLTQYSLATLGYLSLILASLQFRKASVKAVSAVLLLAAGALALGNPYNEYYGKLIGKPAILNEKIIALDVEASRGHWDKVADLSKTDYRVKEASYYYNLAEAVRGTLGSTMLNHSQDYANGLFLWVSDQVSQFTNGMAGEVWYNLGDMTLAEQSAIVALQASPKHTGARYLVRLAQITLITGEYGASQKYLNMLAKTLNYRKWALRMMPGNHDGKTEKWLAEARAKLPEKDIIYGRNEFRPILKGLLDANPDNMLAREYLLCYDLMYFDLEAFMSDYRELMITGKHFEEAICIYLSMKNELSESAASQYGVSRQTLGRLQQFSRNPDMQKNSYWYYYMQAME